MPAYEARVYGIFGTSVHLLATSPREAAIGAMAKFKDEWSGRDDGNGYWWTENVDSICVETPGGGEVEDFVPLGYPDDEDVRPYAGMDNPVSVTQFIKRVAGLKVSYNIMDDDERSQLLAGLIEDALKLTK